MSVVQLREHRARAGGAFRDVAVALALDGAGAERIARRGAVETRAPRRAVSGGLTQQRAIEIAEDREVVRGVVVDPRFERGKLIAQERAIGSDRVLAFG